MHLLSYTVIQFDYPYLGKLSKDLEIDFRPADFIQHTRVWLPHTKMTTVDVSDFVIYFNIDCNC